MTDSHVSRVVCYNSRSILLHGYLAPFIVLQAIIYYAFTDNTSDNLLPTNQTENGPGDNNTLLANDTNATLQAQKVQHDESIHFYEHWVIAVAVVIAAQLVTYLFCHWSVDVKCFLSFNKCNDPYRASYVKVIPTANNGSTELVVLHKDVTSIKQTGKPVLWFEFQKTKFTYNDKIQEFTTAEFPCDGTISFYRQWKGYQEPHEIQAIERQYGRNELEMVVPEFMELFKERALAPFFVFQVFCVGLWCLDEFWYYALLTLFMLVTFEVVLVKQQLRNMQEVRRMGNKPYNVQVFRQNKWKTIKSDELIPGDLVGITRSENNIACDILLLRGSCIVDESTLTGESIPQMKEPLEDIDASDTRRLDTATDAKLHIISGGTKVLQHTAASKEVGCVGYVLKTGFNTSQGKLLRTILFGVKRVTANNFETFCFILFLVVFAVAAAVYVWNKGIEDAKKSRYRLFFECTVIITSVVPPELPIELSLAVNTSLMSLSKLYIYCTEPFRIPFAGKVEYCCFDKTGTLTSDDLVIEGIAGLSSGKAKQRVPLVETDTNNQQISNSSPTEKSSLTVTVRPDSMKNKLDTKESNTDSASSLANHHNVTPLTKCPVETLQVLACCHSLAHLDDGLVGDPLEKKILEAIDWNFSKSGLLTSKKTRTPPLRIVQRFHFNSTLKRMSVVASVKNDNSNDYSYICAAKGAPEMMKSMILNVPANYDQTYLEMSRLGARVLALGRRNLGNLSETNLRNLTRQDVEKNLEFVGFILITCPLKPDSKNVSIELAQSGHRLMMITGDAPLTACHVAKSLQFINSDALILTDCDNLNQSQPLIVLDVEDQAIGDTQALTQSEDLKDNSHNLKKANWCWTSTDDKVVIPFDNSKSVLCKLARQYDLCLTGDSLSYIFGHHSKMAELLIERTKVFARVSPKQKELIVTTLKSAGHDVLMCGDGTNDVGALKHAHVGVALLASSSSSAAAKKARDIKTCSAGSSRVPLESLAQSVNQKVTSTQQNAARNFTNKRPLQHQQAVSVNLAQSAQDKKREKYLEAQKRWKELMEEQERVQLVKLGDASIAAPFTSRLSSVQCTCHIIKQGRCTLVTTLQMFKILALNALLSAYCHSVLYLDGIKFSDAQVTLQGLLSTACFLFITRSQVSSHSILYCDTLFFLFIY